MVLGNKILKSKALTLMPFNGCSDLDEAQGSVLALGLIAIIERGDCMFVDKVRRAQKFGAIAAIVVDNVPGSSSENSPLFSMSGDGTDDVKIPSVFMFSVDAQKLLKALRLNPLTEITLKEVDDVNRLETEESMFYKLKVMVVEV
ncbi:hypothetical protein YQE_02650, partial [Dendroctonus ponderosae]